MESSLTLAVILSISRYGKVHNSDNDHVYKFIDHFYSSGSMSSADSLDSDQD